MGVLLISVQLQQPVITGYFDSSPKNQPIILINIIGKINHRIIGVIIANISTIIPDKTIPIRGSNTNKINATIPPTIDNANRTIKALAIGLLISFLLIIILIIRLHILVVLTSL
jgi:hypothetical protein